MEMDSLPLISRNFLAGAGEEDTAEEMWGRSRGRRHA